MVSGLHVIEKVKNGLYYYKVNLIRNGEPIMERFCEEVAREYSGARFPRNKEIALVISAEVKSRRERPENKEMVFR